MLFRQYVRDNLYDRISTRPFLNNIEKRWIAFQILSCGPSAQVRRRSWGHQDGESNGHQLELGSSNGFCQFQAHLPSRGQPGRFQLFFWHFTEENLLHCSWTFCRWWIVCHRVRIHERSFNSTCRLKQQSENKRRIEASNGYLFSRYLSWSALLRWEWMCIYFNCWIQKLTFW